MVGEPIVLYVCSKCGVKSLRFHMCPSRKIHDTPKDNHHVSIRE